ncbi:hypothetical protein [Staphylococcus xylosus]|uniref:hypothetical protein n=1 Tax=Staphylococcus xylosus TaxID=1288 RepID=UPI000C08AF74|nr:hypothetical protein [Staphylococcus xylosus]MCR1813650.1 hypothetical protein [Staphylococcus xylosus]MDE9439018.1 hypothetical protein [Staphylococcus xylosus]PHS80854.1 hypothetical protein BTM19_08155 [Staphylococcus xylosus]PNZ16661.1 hypothetical protein CD106_02155 [Staphylococcus xylosus]SUM98959.1 Uncharacterised protein [Staphylococcus xylosus]
MLTTIKQSGNNVKYNKQKNRITVQVLTTDKSVEMGTTKTVDPNYQTFKPYELDGNVFRELKDNEKLCVMLDNNKDDNILASIHRGNLTEVVHNGLYGLAIEIDDKPIMTEFIKLVQQNKIKSVQIYTDQVTSLNKLIEKINYIKAISINTK